MCSKHVEAWNKLIIKFSASSWLILINKCNVFCLFSVSHCISNAVHSRHEFNCSTDINIDRHRDFYGSYLSNAIINLQPAVFPFIILQVAWYCSQTWTRFQDNDVCSGLSADNTEENRHSWTYESWATSGFGNARYLLVSTRTFDTQFIWTKVM